MRFVMALHRDAAAKNVTGPELRLKLKVKERKMGS